MPLAIPTLAPIPPFEEPPNWGRLPIEECGERLVPVEAGGRLIVRPLYFELGMQGASETIAVRRGVLDRLWIAARALEAAGVALVIFDGYRPLAVQQALYDQFYRDAALERPELTDEALRAHVGRFVATPTADPLRPPPHRSGGAVDVYLRDLQTGTDLPMGTEPDEASALSETLAFETDPPGEPYATNRRLLYHAMTDAGFANYRGEWWHFDYGNQRWANCTGAPHAIYGIAAEE